MVCKTSFIVIISLFISKFPVYCVQDPAEDSISGDNNYGNASEPVNSYDGSFPLTDPDPNFEVNLPDNKFSVKMADGKKRVYSVSLDTCHIDYTYTLNSDDSIYIYTGLPQLTHSMNLDKPNILENHYAVALGDETKRVYYVDPSTCRVTFKYKISYNSLDSDSSDEEIENMSNHLNVNDVNQGNGHESDNEGDNEIAVGNGHESDNEGDNEIDVGNGYGSDNGSGYGSNNESDDEDDRLII